MTAQAAMTEAAVQREVVGGVDTHKDTHTAAALDAAGRLLGCEQFPATAAGYAALLAWLTGGRLVLVGVEGTGVLRRRPGRVLSGGRDRGGRGRPARPQDPPLARASPTRSTPRPPPGPRWPGGPPAAQAPRRAGRGAAHPAGGPPRRPCDQRADAMRQLKALIVTAPERCAASCAT